MLKKTITYTDYNGNQQTEDFYFNLSKTELARMEMREATLVDGEAKNGLVDRLNSIVARGKGQEIIDTMEDIIQKSYGVRSDDGKRFIKNQEVLDEFTQSPAYDEFFFEMVTDAEAAAAFIDGIVPKDLSSLAQKAETARRKPQDFKKSDERQSLKAVPTPDAVDEYQEIQGEESVPTEGNVASEYSDEMSGLTPEELEVIQKMRDKQ